MLQELKEVALDRRNEIRLSHTAGTVNAYKGYNLPGILTRPLIYNPNGDILAFSSGERGALIKSDKWFKLKGVKPKPNEVYEETGEPLGGMSREKAIRELEANELLNKGYEKYGYKGPLIPVAFFEYNVPFNGGNICCAVSQTLGDTRVINMFDKFLKTVVEEHDKSICEFLAKVNRWVGFGDRILKEQRIGLSNYSSGVGNFTFYRLENGFGLGPVDLSSSELNTDKTERSTIFFLIDMLKVGNYLGNTSLDKQMKKEYQNTFEGEIIPEPIEEKWITRFVG